MKITGKTIWVISFLFLTISCNSGYNYVEKQYYPDGKLLSEKKYTNKEHSDWKETKYFENGNVSSEAEYRNWKFTGTAVIFFPNGQENFQQEYDTSGLSDGLYQLWNQNGQLKETGLYVHGKKDGQWDTFFDNGQKESEKHYKMGEKAGNWIFYREDGTIDRSETY